MKHSALQYCGRSGLLALMLGCGTLLASCGQERTQPLNPEEVVPVDIEILPSSTLFRAGETLKAIVQGRDLIEHPMLTHERTVNAGKHSIHAGGRYDAHLLIPAILPSESRADQLSGSRVVESPCSVQAFMPPVSTRTGSKPSCSRI